MPKKFQSFFERGRKDDDNRAKPLFGRNKATESEVEPAPAAAAKVAPTETREESRNRDRADKTVYKAGKESQYLLLQDGWHASSANYGYVGSQGAIDAMARAGKKHIVIEGMEDVFQHKIDSYVTGKIPREELVESFRHFNGHISGDEVKVAAEDLVGMVDRATAAGMKVHALDSKGAFTKAMQHFAPRGGKPANEEELLSGEMTSEEFVDINIDKRFGELTAGAAVDNINKFLAKGDLKPEQRKTLEELRGVYDKLDLPADTKIRSSEFTVAMLKNVFAERNARDEVLAERIVERTGDDGVAIIFGLAHGAGERDLDEHFGNDNVTKIGLYPNPETLLAMNRGAPAHEMPSTIIFTDHSEAEGRQVKSYKHKGEGIGDEMSGFDFMPHKLRDIEHGALQKLSSMFKSDDAMEARMSNPIVSVTLPRENEIDGELPPQPPPQGHSK